MREEHIEHPSKHCLNQCANTPLHDTESPRPHHVCRHADFSFLPCSSCHFLFSGSTSMRNSYGACWPICVRLCRSVSADPVARFSTETSSRATCSSTRMEMPSSVTSVWRASCPRILRWVTWSISTRPRGAFSRVLFTRHAELAILFEFVIVVASSSLLLCHHTMMATSPRPPCLPRAMSSPLHCL